MRIVDVHAHLDMEPLFQDIEGVISRSVSAGVKVIIANGTNPESNRRVMALSRRYDVVKPALGIYPTETIDYSEEKLDEEIAFIRLKRPFAIGEVGLDYKYADAHDKRGFKEISEQEQQRIKTLQQNAFVKFIKLANELDIPLIVHSRKAEHDVIRLLKEYDAKKVIMHCFMGKKKYVKEIQEQKWMFSIPLLVTKLEQVQHIVLTTPLSRLLTETDAPFLGPDPEKANEPATIPKTIVKIAELKNMTEDEVSNQLFMNYQRLF